MVIHKGHRPVDVAQYVVSHCANTGIDNSLTPMQVLKLVYLAHGWLLGLYGRPLINEQVEAWTYGPVIPSLYQALKQFGSGSVDVVPGARAGLVLDDEEIGVITQVCAIYGVESGMNLSRLTHKDGSPWSVTWQQSGKSGVISNDLIEAYYSKLAAQAVEAA